MQCDKCTNQAKYQLSGAYIPYRLCAKCCANICLENNDQIGYDKFMKEVA